MTPRRRRAGAEQKRLAILEAAAHAIAEHGFHGMSMRELARSTGQALAAFYTYFGSKEDVLFEIQAHAFETLLRTAEDAVGGLESPQDKLFAFIYQHVRYVAEHRDIMRVLVHEAGELPTAKRRVVRELKERYYGLGRRIVAEVVKKGCGGPSAAGGKVADAELERLTYGVFGMLNWTYGWYEPRRHGSPGEVAQSLHRLVLCGVVTQCPARTLDSQKIVERKLSLLAAPPLLGHGEN